jgi:hypothetical protein
MTEPTPRRFFSSLYDLSFHTFITPKIIQIVYVLCLIIVGLISFGFLLSGFQSSYGLFGSSGPSFLSIVGHIIVAPLIFIAGSIGVRLYLEFVIAVFRIAENTESLRQSGEQESRL